jgi:putative (di)nucleoside polyphosphate hydrolase
MIDSDGFRANVGILLCNQQGKLFWARRAGGMDAWQFPQGGIKKNENAEIAMYRELKDEIGLLPDHVWFLLRLLVNESYVKLDNSRKPEFDHWRWIDYWDPVTQVIAFKRNVYEKALQELAPHLFPQT